MPKEAPPPTPLVLFGKLVTFDDEATVIDDGALYIGQDEHIIAGEAVLKYVEKKAVIGGTTAIQGSAKVPHYQGWLVRNVEKETFKGQTKTTRQSVREIDGAARARPRGDGGGTRLHLPPRGGNASVADRGVRAVARCRLPEGEADRGARHRARKAQFDEWGVPGRDRGSVVWSPFSNLWLYGKTTAVAKAREAGVRVCLGSDWSPSGSKNLLGGLKLADLVNERQLDGAFSDEELCRMATSNPADALGWEERLGRLAEGLHGDVLVTSDRGGDPYRNLIEAVERDVLFVAINGYPFYGTDRADARRQVKARRADPRRLAAALDRARLSGCAERQHDLGAGGGGAKERAR